MVRVAGVPVEGVVHTALRDRGADHVGAVGRLLGVNAHPVVDGCRRVGRHDDRVGQHRRRAVVDLRPRGLLLVGIGALHVLHPAAGEDLAAALLKCLGQGADVLERLKPRLPRESQARPGLVPAQDDPLELLHVLKARADRRLQLPVEQVGRVGGDREEVAVDALEIAVDLLFGDDLLDPVDGRRVALVGQLRPLWAMQLLHLHEPVVDGRRQVRAGAAALPGRDGSVVENRDRLPIPREQIRRRQPRDSGADDADVDAQVVRGRRVPGRLNRVVPGGRGRAVGALHARRYTAAI